MIASNFIRYPDALRFQRELFHNGYKNQPRIMRAMECIFKFAPDVPQWVKDAKRLAKQLVKHWKAAQIVLNFCVFIKTAVNQTTPRPKQSHPRFTPSLGPNAYGLICVQGSYRSFCQAHNNWAADRLVYQYAGGFQD
jgi:hypothetical protein